MSKWGHVLGVSKVKTKWRGACCCGWQSERLGSVEEVERAYHEHTKLVEREGRRASEGG